MRIDGEWYQCDDGVIRPVIRADLLAADGTWKSALFLVDSGADRSVISFAAAAALGPASAEGPQLLGALGCVTTTTLIATTIRLPCTDPGPITIPGTFPAIKTLEALDMSVLGQDVLRIFTVILDWDARIVCLVRGSHRYRIEQA